MLRFDHLNVAVAAGDRAATAEQNEYAVIRLAAGYCLYRCDDPAFQAHQPATYYLCEPQERYPTAA